jgi:flagellar basal body-associated protein FliL
MRSIPLIVLGLTLAAGGLIIAGLTFQKPKPESAAPQKKSELRAQEQERKDAVKQRLGGAILVAIGIGLMLIA